MVQIRILILRYVLGSSVLNYIQVSPTDVDTHPQIVNNQDQLHITGLGQVALSLFKQQTKNIVNVFRSTCLLHKYERR